MFFSAVLLCQKNSVYKINSFMNRIINVSSFRWYGSENNVIKTIDKILIANRGEIACRIIKTARKLGVKTVSVYSDVDKNSMHVSMADEAYFIGPAPSNESYLRSDRIIETAKQSNCQAIHPGYGFLSENADFSELCLKEKIIFIGPPASAIRDMGIKSTSKMIMSKAGVPVIKGYHGKDQSINLLKEEALKIGYPVMIKAIRGGGGKGMRIAYLENEFEEALGSARSESQKAFGDGDVLLEKFVAEPRHVEVQVFADKCGNAVYLFERDCSVQRRHQKIIEEAPAPGLSLDLRKELGLAAVRAAKAVGYVGAGTVEFILDRKTHEFFFMEMNTRLQVEHPVTEMITGFDLVEWQIKVASGESLPVKQEDIEIKGHSFEGRIYAEDPSRGFLPGAGRLVHLSTPKPDYDVRIETGVREGDEVSVYYDPMIAKLVVWGKNRRESLNKLHAKLLEFNVAGLQTNVNFLLRLSKHSEFINGNVHTNFIKDHGESLFPTVKLKENQIFQACLSVVLFEHLKENDKSFDPFILEAGFRVNHCHERKLKFTFNGDEHQVDVKYMGNKIFDLSLDNGKNWTRANGEIISNNNSGFSLNFTINGLKGSTKFFINNEQFVLFDQDGKIELDLERDLVEGNEDELNDSSNTCYEKAISPMPGIVDKVFVKVGDEVKEGDALLVLIAMKMEHIIKAARNCKIEQVLCEPGLSVPQNKILIKFQQ